MADRDPDWHIKTVGVIIAMALVMTSLWISRTWPPGFWASLAVELLLCGWMARDLRRDARRRGGRRG